MHPQKLPVHPLFHLSAAGIFGGVDNQFARSSNSETKRLAAIATANLKIQTSDCERVVHNLLRYS